MAGFDYNGPPCQHGPTFLRAPVALEAYNIDGLEAVYDILAKLPSVFNNSALITEAYSVQGVQSVSEESTAYPDRHNNLLLSPFFIYPPDPSLHEQAVMFTTQIQQTLANASGKPLNAYINYAIGYESEEALYGHEAWRLERLRALKRKYDPQGRFDYYGPIKTS